MIIIKHSKIFLAIGAILMIASWVIIGVKGFNLGIDFTGGSVLEVSYSESVNARTATSALQSIGFSAQVQQFGEQGLIVRTAPIQENQKQEMFEALATLGPDISEERFNTVGPSVGRELSRKAILSLIVIALAMIAYIAFAFRNVSSTNSKGESTGVSSWKYGWIAVLALLHDISLPLALFSLFNIEITTLVVVGILTILGVSVNDTIVVFDRIRENILTNKENNTKESFSETVGKSISQTLVRSINTTLTVVVVLIALYVWGPETTKHLSLIMLLGMIFGTYSSVFLASPLLVLFDKKNK